MSSAQGTVATGVRETLRLRLQGSNLPRRTRPFSLSSLTRAAASLPSTYAVVTSVSAASATPAGSVNNANAAGYVWGRTEVAIRSTHPQWTKEIYLERKPGADLLFYIHIFACDEENDHNDDDTKKIDYSSSMGAALFEAGDVLATRHKTRVKRLRRGGVIFCRLEPVDDDSSSNLGDCSVGNGDSCSFSNRITTTDLNQRLQFRFGARNLILPGNQTTYRNENAMLEISKFAAGTNNKWVAVYRSNVALASSSRHSSAPSDNSSEDGSGPVMRWDVDQLDLGTLCNGDLEKPIRLSVVWVKLGMFSGGGSSSSAKTSVIGIAETNLRNLIRLGLEAADEGSSLSEEQPSRKSNGVDGYGDETLGSNELFLQRSLDKYKRVGRVCVLKAAVVDTAYRDGTVSWRRDKGSEAGKDEQEEMVEIVDLAKLAKLQPVAPPSASAATLTGAFQNYIDRGCELEFCVAIDFTSSNGDARSPRSLHYQSRSDQGSCLNDYEETIVSIGKAIDAYSKSRSYAVWGFGAKFGYGEPVRHLFQCGSQPRVEGVDGVLSAYQSVFASDVIMSGPSLLLQVLQAAAVESRKLHDTMTPNSLRYNVLLIITDGLADELEETRRKLAVYSHLPLSVVIVGVGRSEEDFRLMHRLNQPAPLVADQSNCSFNNSLPSRRNTSFVVFRHHQHNPHALGEAALREVPSQLCEYMMTRGF